MAKPPPPNRSLIPTVPDLAEVVAEAVQLRLRWRPTQDLSIQHADQFILTSKGDYFVLTIGQVDEPIFPPNDADAVKELLKVGNAWIRPLARFAIPSDQMADWARNISELVDRVSREKEADRNE